MVTEEVEPRTLDSWKVNQCHLVRPSLLGWRSGGYVSTAADALVDTTGSPATIGLYHGVELVRGVAEEVAPPGSSEHGGF